MPKDPIIEVVPNEDLKFCGPFKYPLEQTMVIKNLIKQEVRFKVKTTAPKFYKVVPCYGLIRGQNKAFITVTLMPFVYDKFATYKHKFKVISIIANPENDLEEWDIKNDGSSHEHKIKSLLLMPREIDQERVVESKPLFDSITTDSLLKDMPSYVPKEEDEGKLSATFVRVNAEKLKKAPQSSPSKVKDSFINLSEIEEMPEEEVSFSKLESLEDVVKHVNEKKPLSIKSQQDKSSASNNQISSIKEEALTAFDLKRVRSSEFRRRNRVMACDIVNDDWALELMRTNKTVPPVVYLLIAFLLGSLFGRLIL